jgi:hypothetical protein
LRFNAAINMCGTRNLSQSPQGEDGSESEYILQNEDEEFEEMYIPQVVSTSETEISSSNVESKDAGAANDKTPTASRKKSNRKTPMNLFKQGKLADCSGNTVLRHSGSMALVANADNAWQINGHFERPAHWTCLALTPPVSTIPTIRSLPNRNVEYQS